MTNLFPARATSPAAILYSTANRSDTLMADKIKLVAREDDIEVLEAFDPGEILKHLAARGTMPVLAVFTDSGSDANSFFESMRVVSPGAPVIVILGQQNAHVAIGLTRSGAFECLGPDATSGDIAGALHGALKFLGQGPVRDAHSGPRALATEHGGKSHLIGRSPALAKVNETVRLVAPRRCTVLISGETGTGKELVARAIHMAGDRARRPMVSVNCSALPENLIEAELFGHVKGAFTGATENRTGRFQQAEGGTIFLDEIGELPYDLQAKLLRVLQEREIQKLGAAATTKINVRVIAATNANLLAMVQRGSFREDLYYRLNVVPIHLPALGERTGDIPLLVRHFVSKVCAAEGLPGKVVTGRALDALSACAWPGNVRQLENVVEQAVVMNAASESLDLPDFSLPGVAFRLERSAAIALPGARLPDEGMDLSAALRQFERAILGQALARAHGNKTLAADMLHIPRTTFIHKLRALGDVA